MVDIFGAMIVGVVTGSLVILPLALRAISIITNGG